ncbi:hypothetical protein ElyMa_001754600 [Elysia marginata]|uniref:Uncharacterized protein n=1 Tax=Elysia marginata TaxID=1093978 RepID=A0AAV4EA01_9GAST|nr:hypothetical protein ElyMa_001754600 [Elysia marginata]
MLMGARQIARRLTHLSHQDSCPAAHGSQLTGRISRPTRIEESDGTTEVRQEDGKKTKQEGKSLSIAAFYCVTQDKHTMSIILCSPPNEGSRTHTGVGVEALNSCKPLN